MYMIVFVLCFIAAKHFLDYSIGGVFTILQKDLPGDEWLLLLEYIISLALSIEATKRILSLFKGYSN